MRVDWIVDARYGLVRTFLVTSACDCLASVRVRVEETVRLQVALDFHDHFFAHAIVDIDRTFL